MVFQESHSGKWDLYGDIFTLTNGGVEKSNIILQNDGIRIRYTKRGIEIDTKTAGTIYRINGVSVKQVAAGDNEIKFGTLDSGIYFVKLETGQTKKFIIK